jgi:parvulin-like peptidyl-prolyl isomerase
MKQTLQVAQAIVLVCLCSIALMAKEIPKEKLLEQLSHRYYMKAYENLKPMEKEKIVQKYEKRERIYTWASKAGIQSSDAYKEYMQIVGEEQAMRLFLQKHREGIVISKKEMQSYYDLHKQEYTRVHAYTLVRKNKKELEDYLKVLRSSSKENLEQTFMHLAKKYSQHPKKAKGGDMGFVAYNTIVQPFGEKVFALKSNNYSNKPFKTVLGWHLVYVKERKMVSFEKVKKVIEDTLISKRYMEWFKSL